MNSHAQASVSRSGLAGWRSFKLGSLCAKLPLIGIYLFALISLSYTQASGVSLAKITKDMYFGSWVGYSEDGLTFYRLVLSEDGTGLCSVMFQEEPARLYRITKWQLVNNEAKLELTPVDKDAFQIGIVASHEGPYIKVRVFGPDGSWSKEGRLVSLNKLMRAIEVTERRVKGDDKR